MAISPWHLKSRLSSEEVSILLTGTAVSDFLSWPKAEDIRERDEWHRVLIRAAQEGNLEPEWAETWENDPVPLSEGLEDEWSWEPSFFDEWKTKYTDGVRLTMRRQEVYRWLKASGIPDDDIPEALRVMPAECQQQSEELNSRREGTYHLIIATLLAMQYSSKELDAPFRLADQVLDDCQAQDLMAPASRNTLGELFKQLPRVQKAPLD